MKHKTITLCAAALGLALSSGAATLDLTTGGQDTLGGALFRSYTSGGAAGTGVFDAFLRLSENRGGTEEGYNTSARPVMPDVNNSPTFTHDLLASSIPTTTIGGITYYEFALDINQNGGTPPLSLDALQLYTSATAFTGNASTLAALQAFAGAPVYDLGANNILLNYDLAGSGSGRADLLAYIPVSGFNNYVYLYSAFSGNNDGYEGWGVREGAIPGETVPDAASTLSLFGLVLTGLGFYGRKLKR